MKPVRVPPANGKGADYVITNNGHQLVLCRNGQTGRPNQIGMTPADVYQVINALADITELVG